MQYNQLTSREAEIKAIVEQHGNDRSVLLPVLQAIQAKYTHIDPHAQQVVADLLGIHPVEVYSVISFYAFLRTEPGGKFVIRLCNTISCEMVGKSLIAKQLEADLGIKFGETTADGMFTLEYAACMGMCDQGPAMLVNDEIHTQVTPDMVHGILEACRSKFGVYSLEEAH